jgi:tetratricopeptide (TPR) repeat protein
MRSMKTNPKAATLILAACLGLLAAASLAAQEKADALALYKAGKFEQASRVCLEELKEMPKNMNSYVVLGWSLLRLGRHQEALECARKAMAISRYDNRIIAIAGEAFYSLGQYLEALKHLEEYVVVSPTGNQIHEVYFLMGEIFIRLGEFNHADIALTAALYHDPNSANWWSRLGYAREQAKDFRAALEAYNKSLQLNAGLGDAVRGKQRVQSLVSGG